MNTVKFWSLTSTAIIVALYATVVATGACNTDHSGLTPVEHSPVPTVEKDPLTPQDHQLAESCKNGGRFFQMDISKWGYTPTDVAEVIHCNDGTAVSLHSCMENTPHITIEAGTNVKGCITPWQEIYLIQPLDGPYQGVKYLIVGTQDL